MVSSALSLRSMWVTHDIFLCSLMSLTQLRLVLHYADPLRRKHFWKFLQMASGHEARGWCCLPPSC